MGGLSNIFAGPDFEGPEQITACNDDISLSLSFSSTACLQSRPTIDEQTIQGKKMFSLREEN